MKKHGSRLIRVILLALLCIGALTVVAVAFFFQAYAVFNRKEGDSRLPPLFGNFPANRALLEKQEPKDEFSFAVIGDTRSVGTFERIVEDLKGMPLDFAVLLGDCSYDGTEEEHRYFRAEWAGEYAMPFPVFYVVGNHDVDPDGFPISRFEQVYGPGIFSFEYQQCLFIVLRILDPPFSNEESIEFLRRFLGDPPQKYLHRFVFMHIPPVVSSDFTSRSFAEDKQIVQLFDEVGVDYVFAGDYHGYAKIKLRNTVYIVSGGGGAPLKESKGRQFHHALMIRIGKDFIAERFIHVPKVDDLEDFIERATIVEVWPWMVKHKGLTIILDILGFMLVLGLLKRAVFPLLHKKGGILGVRRPKVFK